MKFSARRFPPANCFHTEEVTMESREDKPSTSSQLAALVTSQKSCLQTVSYPNRPEPTIRQTRRGRVCPGELAGVGWLNKWSAPNANPPYLPVSKATGDLPPAPGVGGGPEARAGDRTSNPQAIDGRRRRLDPRPAIQPAYQAAGRRFERSAPPASASAEQRQSMLWMQSTWSVCTGRRRLCSV